jgi:hypothetical protein
MDDSPLRFSVRSNSEDGDGGGVKDTTALTSIFYNLPRGFLLLLF